MNSLATTVALVAIFSAATGRHRHPHQVAGERKSVVRAGPGG
jgi:hypothetical protein